MEQYFKGGVLIIGSLYWQDHQEREGDEIRKKWRDTFLEISHSVDVTIPIRYGRFSTKEQTYTMVFDYRLPKEKFGRGKAVPLKKQIQSIEDVIICARELSLAEGKYDNMLIKGRKSPAWGVCGLSFNPKISVIIKKEFLANWELTLKENKIGYETFLKKSNDFSLSQNGEFLFDFPSEAIEFDFLIAVSTDPILRNGIAELTPAEIAQYVGNREYFYPNQEHGIITYQDGEIKRVLIN